MSTKVFNKSNISLNKHSGKLYLDSEKSDVNFLVFIDDNQFETVPAHKLILSIGSPVFDAMFYGPMKETGDVKIVDTSPDAIKEFLQFLYLNEVRLTSDNIIEVIKLCHKYEMSDALKVCESVLQSVLTTKNMCSGYALSLLLYLESTIEFCEKQIVEKSREILNSTDFLACDRNTLDKILKLVLLTCDPSTIVESSMAWAKAECERNKLESTPSNLRTQLNDSFHRIPFADLSKEQFSQLVGCYKRFFNDDDWKEIVLQTLPKRAKMMDITFSFCTYSDPSLVTLPLVIKIELNTRLLLTEIHFTGRSCVGVSITLTNPQSKILPILLGTPSLTSTDVVKLILPVPMLISPNVTYILKINCERRSHLRPQFRSIIKFSKQEDVVIHLSPCAEIIKDLVFEKLSP